VRTGAVQVSLFLGAEALLVVVFAVFDTLAVVGSSNFTLA
jgi:hypothetical protein